MLDRGIPLTTYAEVSVREAGAQDLACLPQSAAAILRSTLGLEPGFVDVLACVELSCGQVICVTLWRQEEDAHRYRDKQAMPVVDRLLCAVHAERHARN